MKVFPQLIRNVLALAIPVALQMLMQSMLGMADILMVGNLGSATVAAVGLAAKIHFLMLVLMTGLATGASVLIAQYMGANDSKTCQKIFAATMLVSTFVVLPFTLLFGFLSSVWVSWINPDTEVVNLAVIYLTITAPVLLLTQWIVNYEASLRATGHTTLPLIAGFIAAVTNVLINYALINGHWGFPAMGVAGAAWGTLISRLLQIMVTVIWVYASKQIFALTLLQWQQAKDKFQIIRYIQFSTPLVANYTIWAVGNSVYHLLTGFAGTQALAVMGVIVPIETTFFALFIGLANAAAVLTGRELGANNMQSAWYLHQFFDRLTLLLLAIFCVVLWLSRASVVNLFDQLDSKSQQLLLSTMGLFCFIVPFKMFNMVRIVGILRAGGDIRFTLITDTTVMWLIGIPIFITAVFFWKLSFIYLYALMYLEDALKFIPVWKRIFTRKWMKNLTREGTH